MEEQIKQLNEKVDLILKYIDAKEFYEDSLGNYEHYYNERKSSNDFINKYINIRNTTVRDLYDSSVKRKDKVLEEIREITDNE